MPFGLLDRRTFSVSFCWLWVGLEEGASSSVFLLSFLSLRCCVFVSYLSPFGPLAASAAAGAAGVPGVPWKKLVSVCGVSMSHWRSLAVAGDWLATTGRASILLWFTRM